MHQKQDKDKKSVFKVDKVAHLLSLARGNDVNRSRTQGKSFVLGMTLFDIQRKV